MKHSNKITASLSQGEVSSLSRSFHLLAMTNGKVKLESLAFSHQRINNTP